MKCVDQEPFTSESQLRTDNDFWIVMGFQSHLWGNFKISNWQKTERKTVNRPMIREIMFSIFVIRLVGWYESVWRGVSTMIFHRHRHRQASRHTDWLLGVNVFRFCWVSLSPRPDVFRQLLSNWSTVSTVFWNYIFGPFSWWCTGSDLVDILINHIWMQGNTSNFKGFPIGRPFSPSSNPTFSGGALQHWTTTVIMTAD